jgi:hypothetical protein
MKPRSPLPLRFVAALLWLLLFGLSGCLRESVVWSPDGKHAAVVAAGKLHLCAPDGTLSHELASDVVAVRWLSDSQRIVIAQKHRVPDWETVAAILGPETARSAANLAEGFWTEMQKTGSLQKSRERTSGLDFEIGITYLKSRYGEKFRLAAGSNWEDVQDIAPSAVDLSIQHLSSGGLGERVMLHRGFLEIGDIRVAKGGATLAFTTAEEALRKSETWLWVVPTSASEPATRIAQRVSLCPDWKTDSRTLVYIAAMPTAYSGDMVKLATVFEQKVITNDEKISTTEAPVELAGLVFNEYARVRCLPDGRILFNCPEVTLPMATKDAEAQREQIFALDPARYASLVRMIPQSALKRLPAAIAYFEPSPSGTELLIAGVDGEVVRFTLATGEATVVQSAHKDSSKDVAPAWRGDGEFSYIRATPVKGVEEATMKVDLVLQSGDSSATLNQTWSPEFWKAFTD